MKFILKTTGSKVLPVLRIPEAEVRLKLLEFDHLGLVVNILDDLLMGLPSKSLCKSPTIF